MNRSDSVFSFISTAASKWPNSIALKTAKKEVSYSELFDLSCGFASFFEEKGVAKGNRVIVVSNNSIEVVGLYFGLLKCRAVVCPVYYYTPDERVKYIESDALSVFTIHADEDGFYFNGEFYFYSTFRHLSVRTDQSCTPDSYDPCPNDLAFLLYTSGSTGQPKGVAGLNRQVVFATLAISEVVDYRVNDRVFCASPFSFDYGLYQIFICLQKGACLYLASYKESGSLLLKSLRDSEATVLAAVPTQLNCLAVLLDKVSACPVKLRNITTTGSAVPQATLDKLRKSLSKTTIQLMYGLTECKRVSITPPNGHLEKKGTCGIPLPSTEVIIVDEKGENQPPGAEGMIVVRGPHLMAGYWNDSEKTGLVYKKKNAVLEELITGDYGFLDTDGYLYCTGRKDELFKQKGFRVSCIEVEAAAASITSVRSCVLLPPAGRRGSILFVASSGESSQIKEKLREKLEDYKLPDKIKVIDELPLNLNGKIDKKYLSALV